MRFNIRNPQEVARRVKTLIGVFQAATGRKKEEVIKILKDKGLWSEVSENEKNFLLSPEEESRFIALQLGWRAESVYILLWALNYFNFSEIPKDETNLDQIKEFLKADDFYSKIDSDNVQLRDPEEIRDIFERVYKINWELRDAQINDKELPNGYNPSIIYEWHYALEWVIKENEEWDYIAVDT